MTSEEPPATAEAFTATMRQGVLWIEWSEGTSVGDTDAVTLIERADAISRDAYPPMLVQLNGMVTLTRNALLRFAKDLDVVAMAIVGPSAVDKAIADFFTEVHEPPYPTRYFQHQEHALAWLTSYPHAA
ncbi:DUF7793 family protein [Arthrobacter agilis]|uniref:DUF7793 family protein n=1 Tax=Arthrobacter agilis TaxID=37921 RepID=UPI00277F0744|nr:hypothetical protein [Arthrobacter agilis]MDQ0736179.1 hypothetical protein [Arthrobacter agilis]